MKKPTSAMMKALAKWSDGRASHYGPKGVRYDTFKRLWDGGYLANSGFLVCVITDKGREALESNKP